MSKLLGASIIALTSLWSCSPQTASVGFTTDLAVREITATERHDDIRLSSAQKIIGGAPPDEAMPFFVQLTIFHTEFVRSHCGGTLMEGGWVVTAAHCVAGDRWVRVEANVGVAARDSWGSARYSLGKAYVHELYEGRDSNFRHDVALLKLPDDPGGGLKWPQTPQIQLEVGEVVTVCGMGLTETGMLSDSLLCATETVVFAHPAMVMLDGSTGGFRQADSGGGVFRTATGTLVGLISHYDGSNPDVQFILPLPTKWVREVFASI